MKKDCSNPETLTAEFMRMCSPSKNDKHYCKYQCPLYYYNMKDRNQTLDVTICYQTIKAIPDDLPITQIMQQWSDCHEEFTRLELLLNTFPNTPLDDGLPEFCPDLLGYKTDGDLCLPTNKTEKCHICWGKTND